MLQKCSWSCQTCICQNNESIFSQKLGSCDFWWIANSVLSKGKTALSLYLMDFVLSFASDQANFFVKNFSKNLNFDDSNISLLTFLLELIWNCMIFMKLTKLFNVITNLDSSKPCDPDCILAVVLKKCESGLSHTLAELFDKSLNESCFPGC